METNLRPLSLGEILDRTAQLYRTNFLLFAGIFSAYAGVVLVLGLLQVGIAQMLLMLHQTAPIQWLTWIFAGIMTILAVPLTGVTVAAISRAVAWVHLGEPASIRSAYSSILPLLKRYLWLTTLTSLIAFASIAVLYVAYFGTMAYFVKGFGTNPAAQQAALSNPQTAIIMGGASIIFALLCIPTGIYAVLMTLRYSLAVPASVVENLNTRLAIRRSIDLSKGARGSIFVLGLLVGAIKIGLVLVTQVFVFIAAFKHPGQPLSPGITALSQIISFFTTTFLGPIMAIGITLFYFDQRVRKEGYDIEWMMQAAGMTVPTELLPSETVANELAATADPSCEFPGNTHE